MSLIKETIRFNNLDVNLKFALGSGIGFTGYQQEVDNLTIATGEELINPVVDTEVRKFIYKPNIAATNLLFYFSNTNTFQAAGFTTNEIITSNTKLLNSFFILDFYNTYNSNTQTKIFTTYLTKILGSNNNTPNYKIFNDTVNQFYNWYIPKSYLDIQTGSTVIGYVKFSFFNAKTGRISLFYNNENLSLLTPEKMYFKTQLDLVNMTWTFILTYPPNAEAYELINTSAYVTKVNDTIGKFDDKKQNYPTGNTFQSTTGTYIIE